MLLEWFCSKKACFHSEISNSILVRHYLWETMVHCVLCTPFCLLATHLVLFTLTLHTDFWRAAEFTALSNFSPHYFLVYHRKPLAIRRLHVHTTVTVIPWEADRQTDVGLRKLSSWYGTSHILLIIYQYQEKNDNIQRYCTVLLMIFYCQPLLNNKACS